MEIEDFPDARKMRKALKPRMTLREMSRKMNVSCMYLSDLERGNRGCGGWPIDRKRDFQKHIREWTKNPTPKARKKRVEKPRQPKGLLPVPHPHGELAGVG